MSSSPIDLGSPYAGGEPSGGFFQFHGIWAPGVRAFRRLMFRSKAVLIMLAMAVPTVLLGTVFIQARLETIETAELERLGVAYVKEATTLQRAVAEYQRAPISLSTASRRPQRSSNAVRACLGVGSDFAAASIAAL